MVQILQCFHASWSGLKNLALEYLLGPLEERRYADVLLDLAEFRSPICKGLFSYYASEIVPAKNSSSVISFAGCNKEIGISVGKPGFCLTWTAQTLARLHMRSLTSVLAVRIHRIRLLYNIHNKRSSSVLKETGHPHKMVCIFTVQVW